MGFCSRIQRPLGSPSDFHSQPGSPPSLGPSRHQDQTFNRTKKNKHMKGTVPRYFLIIQHLWIMNHVSESTNLGPEWKCKVQAMEEKLMPCFLKETKFPAQVHLLREKPGKWENQSPKRNPKNNKTTRVDTMNRAYEKGDSTKQGPCWRVFFTTLFFIVCVGKVENWKCQLAASNCWSVTMPLKTRVYPETLSVSNHQTSNHETVSPENDVKSTFYIIPKRYQFSKETSCRTL